MKAQFRWIVTVVVLSTLHAAVSAQGAGVVGAQGLEPRITPVAMTAGASNTLRLFDLTPGGALWIAGGPQTANQPYPGVPGAVLGVNILPGALGVVLGPFTVPANGTWTAAWNVPSGLLGQTVYLQAACLDGQAVAVSDAAPLSFGQTDVTRIASLGSNTETLVRLFADGQHTAPVLPSLSGLTFLPRTLTATHDTLQLRNDVPAEDASDPARPRIALPHGRALYHYREIGGRYGFFLVTDHGEQLIPLVDAPPTPQGNPFEPQVAASPFEPLAALVSDEPLPQFGGAQLLLVRVDGRNFTGKATPIVPVLFSGALAGFEPDSDSLTFAQRSLFMSDGERVVRLRTDLSSPPEHLPLPPSGGLVPSEVDEELAFSADGTLVAFTAGQSDEDRDLYIAYTSGPAINLTQSPGEYEDVSYKDLVDGGRIALSPDGTRIAYVKSIAGSPEIFVRDTAITSPSWQLTGPTHFVSTIEQEGGIMMATASRVYFNAGAGDTDHDTYQADVPLASLGTVSVSNVTATSGVLAPPFNVGATLFGVQRGAVSDDRVVYVMQDAATNRRTIVELGPQGSTTQLATDVLDVKAQAFLSDGSLLALARAQGTSEIWRIDGQGSQLMMGLPSGTTVQALASTGEGFGVLALTHQGSSDGAMFIDAGGITPFPGFSRSLLVPAPSSLPSGEILLIGRSTTAWELISLDPQSGTSQTLAPLGAGGRFF